MAGPSSDTPESPSTTASLFGPGVPPLPADATPEQKDLHWFKHVYQGDRMPQLTWRAVLMGGFLGMLMSAANLYTTLSIGWAFGIAITACVLSFVVWNFVRFCSRNNLSQMSVLENACMASCASAAGYSTGSTIATMFGALVLLKDVPEGVPLRSIATWDVTPPWVVVVFTLCTGLMGVFLAIPMKRQQINHEQLPFPSGIAAAETLRSLYSASKEAMHKAYMLVVGLGLGLFIGFLRAGDENFKDIPLLKSFFEKISFLRIPEKIDIALFDRLYPGTRHAAGFAFEPSALLIAAGMIVGMRTSISLVVSSLILYGVVGPQMAHLDAAHMSKGGDAIAAITTPYKEGKVGALVVRDESFLAIDKAIDALDMNKDSAKAIKAAARRGAAEALGDINKAKAAKAVEAIAEAAHKAGLETSPIKNAARRMAQNANDGADKSRSDGAIVAAVRLARAKKADPQPIIDAAKKADLETTTITDKEVGDTILKAVLAAADAEKDKVDTARIQKAADTARAAASANPGRESAKAARDTAATIIYDELENDPNPLKKLADAAAAKANEAASKKVADAIVAAVIAESTKLGLDTKTIIASADAAGKVAEDGEGAAMTAAAMEAALFAADQAKVDASAIKAAPASVKFTDEEEKENAKHMAEAIGTTAGKPAAELWANRDAIAARDAAVKEAEAKKLKYKPTQVAGETAFEHGKYRPNLIWNFGTGEITLTRWSLWGGTSLMVFASLTAVALQWRSLVRAFRGQRSEASVHESAELARIEVPFGWMVAGMIPITLAMVWLQVVAFDVSWYAGLIAVGMSFVLALVASRATGETDTTPIGAMGKVMQLTFAALAPKNMGANLASAGIAANSASSCADLLTDLKTGYLLGANPRKQFLAQFFGVFFGTLAIVPIWYLMVPNREALEKFDLPSTRAWEAVARILVKGISELPTSAVWSILIGAFLGIALPVTEKLLPAKARRFMPSATGMGLAWVMPFQNAFSFFLGAVIAWLWIMWSRKNCEKYNIPIASGLIAGESLMAAGMAIAGTVAGLIAAAAAAAY